MRARRTQRSRRAGGFSADSEQESVSSSGKQPPSLAATNKSNDTADDLGHVQQASARQGRPVITQDDRLREEIAHPLRRLKLVGFGTLTISATIGTLFALGRFALGKDALDVVALNCLINIPAVGLFGWLAKREADFGRRALGVIAKCTEARDLPLQKMSQRSGLFGGLGAQEPRLESVRRRTGRDVYVVAGRAREVADVLVRASLSDNDNPPVIVAVALDAGALDPTYLGPTVVCGQIGSPAERDSSDRRAWEGWLAQVRRPRKNIAVFRIPKNDSGRGMGDEYLLQVQEPASLDFRDIVLQHSANGASDPSGSQPA